MPEILEPNRDAKCINCQPEPVIFLETVAAADTETIPQAAQRYARQGWHVFPAPATGEKKSLKSKKFSDGRNWGKTIDETEIQRDWQQWPNANVCIAAGAGSGIWVMEIDTKAGHDVDGAATLAALEATHGALPTTKQAESPSGSIHYYFLWPDDGRVIPNSTSAIGAGIDVRGEGGMVMAPPSIRPGKGVYRWRNSAPVAAPPPWLLELIFAATRSGPHIPGANPEADPVLVNGALAVLPNPDLNRDEWNKMLMAAWRASGGSEETYPAALAWSQKSSKYHNAATTRERWDHYAQSPPTEIGAGTLFRLAWQADPTGVMPMMQR